jgi:hypothetical protein
VVGGAAAAAKASSWLSRLLDLLVRMGAAAAVVPTGANAQWTIRPQNATSYVLAPEACYEEPAPPPAEPAASEVAAPGGGRRPQAAAGGAQPKVRRTFDLRTPAGRNSYWCALNFVVCCGGGGGGGGARGARSGGGLSRCFPFSCAPEATTDRGWASRRALQPDHVARVQSYLAGDDVRGITWERCLSVASSLNVSCDAVVWWVRERRVGARGAGGGRAGNPLGRLGGLGAPGRRRGGGGGGRGGRRGAGASRRRRRGGESDDEDAAGAAAELALGGGGGAAPQRKKSWRAEEDAALLRSWAAWLARHGPDKIMYWRSVEGRPPAVSPSSLRLRLRSLARHPALGAAVLLIKQLASGAHSRRVLREAAAAGAGAGAGGDGDGGAVAAGDKRGAPLGEGAAPEGQPAAKRARVAEEGGQEQVDPGEGPSAPAEPPLFAVEDEQDAAALRQVLEEIERVVAAAPKRPKGAAAARVELGDRRRRSAAAAPPPLLPGALGAPPPARVADASLGRAPPPLARWAAAAAAAAAAAGPAPPPAVAAAMDLAKSLLLEAAEVGAGAEADASALTARFSADEVRAAFAELVRGGLVVAAAAAVGAAPAVALSQRFRAELRPLCLDAELFQGAEAAAQALARSGGADAALLLPGGDGEAAAAGGGGAVAAALAAVAAGAAALVPAVPPPLTDAQRVAATEEGEGGTAALEQAELLHALRGTGVAAAPVAAGAADAGAPAAAPAAGAPVEVQYGATTLRYTSAPEVLFQPSLVAASGQVRAAAQAACRTAFAAQRLAGGGAGLDAALRALRAAGREGLSPAQVLPGAQPAARRAALATLRRHGLARRVAGFSAPAYYAAEHSQAWVAFPAAPPHGSAPDRLAALEAAVRAAALPPQGAPQPLLDVPLRPWVLPSGRLNAAMWSALVRRAASLVLRHPGVSGGVAAQALRLVSAASAGEVLRALRRAGAVRTRRAPPPAGGSSPRSVLDACFGGAGAEEEGAAADSSDDEDEDEVDGGEAARLYVPVPGRCWALSGALPPQVLVEET